MTELIYLTDSYQRQCKSKVIDATQKGDHWEIVLDRTVFYPQGGGQPSDRGTITGKNGKASVTHVRLRGDTVIHECTLDGTISAGDAVDGVIDWEVRYYNMRVHSAGHIVHEAVNSSLPQMVAIGGQHGSNPYIEYQGSLTIDKQYQIEQKANEIVSSDASLTTELVTLDELKERASWVPAHLPKNKPLRILSVGKFPPIPDGGTQVKKANEVGSISITAIDNDDNRVRVRYSVPKNTKKQKKSK